MFEDQVGLHSDCMGCEGKLEQVGSRQGQVITPTSAASIAVPLDIATTSLIVLCCYYCSLLLAQVWTQLLDQVGPCASSQACRQEPRPGGRAQRTTIMDNQMEKKIENEMETGIIWGYVGVILGFQWALESGA